MENLIISNILINTFSGIITNLPWFLMVYWAVKTISKQMPQWISEYFRLREHEMRLKWAKGEIKSFN